MRDEIACECYPGALRGAQGCLRSRAGNAVDKAVLLAELLRRAGHEVRFAFGRLSEDAAIDLLVETELEVVGLEGARLDFPYELDEPSIGAERAQALAALQKLVESRREKLLTALDSALGVRTRGGDTGRPALPWSEAVTEAREHVWVQLVGNGTPVDLDPTFWDARAGQRFADVARVDSTIPVALWHEIELAVHVERFDGSRVADEVLTQWTGRAADLSTVPLVVECAARAGDVRGLGVALGTGSATHVVALRVGGAPVATAAFALDGPVEGRAGGFGGLARGLGGPGGGGADGAPFVVSVGVELVSRLGDRAAPPIRRNLLDRWPFAARAANDVTPLRALKPDSAARGRLEGTALSFAVETGSPNAAQVQDDIIAAAQETLDALVLTDGRLRVRPGRHDRAARLYGEAYFWILDRLSDQTLELRPRAEAPRLTLAQLAGDAGASTLTFDVSRESRRLVDDTLDDPWRARFESGLLGAIVEEELTLDVLAEDPRERKPSPGSAQALEESLPQGAPILIESVAAIPTAASADGRARMRGALERGRVVLAPCRWSEGAPTSWVELDPRTGELEATVDTGLHQDASERIGQERDATAKSQAASRFRQILARVHRCVLANLDVLFDLALRGDADPSLALEAGQAVAKCLEKTRGATPRERGGRGPKPPRNHRFDKTTRDHVREGHVAGGAKAKPGEKGLWTNENEMRSRTRQTLGRPDSVQLQQNGKWQHDRSFKEPVGVDRTGRPTRHVRVISERDGRIVTSFPSDGPVR